MPEERQPQQSSIAFDSNTDKPAECTRVVEPNKMTYADPQGIRHEIYLPKGTFRTASAYYVDKNYEELAKFPVWANQKYDDEYEKGN